MSLFFGISRVPRTCWAAWRILGRQFGYTRSVRERVPLDGAGREIPWFTYPAIEYLSQFDFSDKSIFEFGAGHSSVFWSRRAARVVTIEHDATWCQQVRARLAVTHELYLVEAPAEYAQMLSRVGGRYDVIVVDGIERRACCKAAIEQLEEGGLVILDNGDWHHHCAALLRAAGLLEVDFKGFGPVNGYTWTTSLFFHRDFNFRTRQLEQPVHGIGSLPHKEEL